MAEKLSKEIVEKSLESLPGWKHDEDKTGQSGGSIKKIFNTSGYPVTMGLVSAIGSICQRINHHPDYILMKYKELEVSFSTHSAGGITEKDIEAAKELEKIHF
jgi:4a-hydroxytetrahydrobiopterin dehydratase